MNEHHHSWLPETGKDWTWQKCGDTTCQGRRHRPIDQGDATVCPKTADGEHQWQPLSFRFETQLLDDHGRVQVRQPDLERGRVYAICMPCRSHTYIDTAWVGYYLGHPWMEEEEIHYSDDEAAA